MKRIERIWMNCFAFPVYWVGLAFLAIREGWAASKITEGKGKDK